MKKIAITIPEEVLREVDARGNNRSGTISRDLGRYYALLKRGLKRAGLTREEALLVCDALNGTLHEPETMRLVWAQVEDACRLDQLDRKWGVDGAALVEKLKGLDELASAAVVDATERFWEASGRGLDAGAALEEAFGIREEGKE